MMTKDEIKKRVFMNAYQGLLDKYQTSLPPSDDHVEVDAHFKRMKDVCICCAFDAVHAVTALDEVWEYILNEDD